MTDRSAKRTFLLGTAVTITIVLSVPSVTSAKITIDNPSEIEQVTLANMTNDASKVYSYIYQSSATGVAGDYLATFTLVYNSYTTIYQEKFTLVEQE